MARLTLIAMLFLPLLAGCGKEEKKSGLASTWQVNGEPFSSDKAKKTVGKAAAVIQCRDGENGFNVGFNQAGLPRTGTFWLKTTSSATGPPDSVGMDIIYRGVLYTPKRGATISATDNAGFASYNLQLTWFSVFNNPLDSILVSGSFNEP